MERRLKELIRVTDEAIQVYKESVKTSQEKIAKFEEDGNYPALMNEAMRAEMHYKELNANVVFKIQLDVVLRGE